jgi:hypothetical protein
MQAQECAGEDGAHRPNEAETAVRGALKVFSREHDLTIWGMLRVQLIFILGPQGVLQEGSKGAQLLEEAIRGGRQAFALFPVAPMRKPRLLFQFALGRALTEQGVRQADEAGTGALAEGVQRLRQAAEALADEPSTGLGGEIHGMLGVALFQQGRRRDRKEGIGKLLEAGGIPAGVRSAFFCI